MKSVNDFARAKQLGHPITMITCYDYTSAMIVASSDVDCILVGDSSAMVMHGHHTTTMATMAHIEMHTAAVSRAQGRQFLIADLPFMSTRKGLTHSVEAVERLIQAGAQAVKLEGAEGHIDLVAHTVSSGVPVMAILRVSTASGVLRGSASFATCTRTPKSRLSRLMFSPPLPVWNGHRRET